MKISDFSNEGVFVQGKGYAFKTVSPDVRINKPIPDVFTPAETGRILRLAYQIDPQSAFLAVVENESYLSPITKADIRESLGLHRATFNAFWKKLLDNDIIYTVVFGRETYYVFNPEYFVVF